MQIIESDDTGVGGRRSAVLAGAGMRPGPGPERYRSRRRCYRWSTRLPNWSSMSTFTAGADRHARPWCCSAHCTKTNWLAAAGVTREACWTRGRSGCYRGNFGSGRSCPPCSRMQVVERGPRPRRPVAVGYLAVPAAGRARGDGEVSPDRCCRWRRGCRIGSSILTVTAGATAAPAVALVGSTPNVNWVAAPGLTVKLLGAVWTGRSRGPVSARRCCARNAFGGSGC